MKLLRLSRQALTHAIALGRRRDGLAALELAIVAPAFITVFVGIVDFSIAFYERLQLIAAISNGVQYAFDNGQALTDTSVGTYLTNVGNVVQNSSQVSMNTPTVLYNNASGNTNFGTCYCISNGGSWTATSCGDPCSTNGPTAGNFVTITASYNYSPIIANPFLSAGTVSDTVVVRIQ